MRTTMAAQHRMETSMSIKTKFAALALAALAVTGTIASTTQAQAKPLHWALGAGLVGAAIVGSAIAASNDGYYYDGYRRCGFVRQFDAYGNYIGRVRHCGFSDGLGLVVPWICVRHGRLIHPRAAPDPPGCPPGRVNFFGLTPAQIKISKTTPCKVERRRIYVILLPYSLLQNCHLWMAFQNVRPSDFLLLRITRTKDWE